ncbi:prolipoprotein diacylglyceryl transferase [Thermatribacter velox]|uniref:Phosphatidylglycerol--prolipoprotein diacylglyceryl transferase n=1 Tax=Thermatribacter velox TaxID=3039681 RepID=A0ABZ2YG86_9BACT
MRRILFYLGSLPVYSYGVMLGVAFLVGVIYAMKRAQKYQVSQETVVEVSILAILGAILGSRITYVILNWELYKNNFWHIFNIREGGLTFLGGLIGGLLLVLPYLYLKKQSLLKLFDIFSPPLALGYAIARIGCFLNGCCYGRVCTFNSFPLGVHFPNLSGFRYPTQIYSSLYSLIILFVLLRLERKKPFEGALFFDYLWLYGVARFLIEYWRDEPFAIAGLFTEAQLASIFLIIAGLFLKRVIKSYVSRKPSRSN